MANEIRVGDGITIRTRNNSKYWQACIASKVGKEALKRTTRTTNRKEAEAKAIQLATQFWENEAVGTSTSSRRFNQVADLYVKQMEFELKNGTGKQQYKESIRIVRNNFIPFFGTQLVGAIGIDGLRGYVEWRKEKRKGKEISWSYQKNEDAAFNGLMEFAYQRKWVATKLKLPKVITSEATNRVKFTDKESRQLRAELKKQSILPSKCKTTMKIRQLMWDYYLFLQNTGIRCGKECLRIKWSQFEFVEKDELRKSERVLVASSKQSEVIRIILNKGETKTGKGRQFHYLVTSTTDNLCVSLL